MKNLCHLLSGLLLLAAGPVRAQAPLQAAQTISLGDKGSLAGTLSLPNHNVLLLLTDVVSLDITAQCLGPDGRTLWKTTLTRYQRLADRGVGLFDTRRIALGGDVKAEKQLKKDKVAARLDPVNVLTDGNEVVLAEYLGDVKSLNKAGATPLREDQVFVQRLDEQGRLTKFLFEPRPAPDSKKVWTETLGRYADANGFVQVLRETDRRDKTVAFYAVHYDLSAKTVRREPLELPATPAPIGSMSKFRYWYQDWAYLGHRPNQTYFCRRTLVGAPKDKPGAQPLAYQVHIADDRGAPAGGFRTTLDLNKGTQAAYSGAMRSTGELYHIPDNYTPSGSNFTYDGWQTTTGGFGSFYLDYPTGDVLIYGEYCEGSLPGELDKDLLGYFERRYAADGRVLAQVQGPYSAAMRDKKKRLSFKGYLYRQTRFHLDPLTGQSQYSFSPLQLAGPGAFSRSFEPQHLYGESDDFDLLMDRDLKPLRYDFLPGKDRDDRTYTAVAYPQPFKLTNRADEIRLYEHAAKDDHPVYAALEKKRRTAGPDAPDHWFYLSPTSPATGLVVEQKQALGGQLQVYTF